MGVDALELDSRRRIYEYVRDHPGAYVREVMTALGMPQGQVNYHLDQLEHRGLLVHRKEEYHKRYFLVGQIPREHRSLAKFLKSKVPRAILMALLQEPGLAHGVLAQKVGVSPPTLTYHIKRLEREQVVRREHDGALVRYHVGDEDALIDGFVTYRASLMDGAVDGFLQSWLELHPGHLRKGPPLPPAEGAPRPGRPAEGSSKEG